MLLIKCELLKRKVHSIESTLYHLREQQNAYMKREWKASNLSKFVNADVNFNLHFPLQTDRQGIGFGKFGSQPYFWIGFVKAGTKIYSKHGKHQSEKSKLIGITDWKLLTDFDNKK